ncbi:MAG: hypothetical protein QM484_01940 [Woeseiaceae bacterium]
MTSSNPNDLNQNLNEFVQTRVQHQFHLAKNQLMVLSAKVTDFFNVPVCSSDKTIIILNNKVLSVMKEMRCPK